MSLHSFDPDIAAQVGVNAAVIYQNFLFWCEKNKANKRHVMDGYVWTYNSRRALGDLFPYFTDSQIKTAIAKLVDAGLLVKGEYNLASYDRTNWYAPAISAEWVSAIGQKSPMERPKIANGLAKNDQPIPDSKPDKKPDGKLLSCDEPDPFDVFWDQYPHRNGAKKGKDVARKSWDRAIKKNEKPEHIIAGAMRYAADRQVLDGYAKNPSTWINQRGWEDDVEQQNQFSANRGVAGQSATNGYGQGGSIASVVARRRLNGEV